MTQLVFGVVLIALAAVLGFYGTQLARDGWTRVFMPPSTPAAAQQRPYVVFAEAQLILPSDRSQPIQVTFDLKNIGQTEAIGSMRDFTYNFSVDPRQKEFGFHESQRVSFRLAPNEQWRGYFLPTFVLSEDKLKALNSGEARLFVYAKGEYRDSAGIMFEMPFSRMYHQAVRGMLAIVPDDIVFK
jgi:hypothetical protein